MRWAPGSLCLRALFLLLVLHAGCGPARAAPPADASEPHRGEQASREACASNASEQGEEPPRSAEAPAASGFRNPLASLFDKAPDERAAAQQGPAVNASEAAPPAEDAAADGAPPAEPQPPEPVAGPPLPGDRNFALLKDGAKVLGANPEARKPAAVLDDDGDTYLKNDCKADKWLALELSQVAKVQRVALSQFELYSSKIREFELYGRQSHPRANGADLAAGLASPQWRLLGNFTAEKCKGTQSFVVQEPTWVRFLLFRFLSHHGSEPICALNAIAVYGKSAADELEDQLADAHEELLEAAAGAAPADMPAAPLDAKDGPAAAAGAAPASGDAAPEPTADAAAAGPAPDASGATAAAAGGAPPPAGPASPQQGAPAGEEPSTPAAGSEQPAQPARPADNSSAASAPPAVGQPASADTTAALESSGAAKAATPAAEPAVSADGSDGSSQAAPANATDAPAAAVPKAPAAAAPVAPPPAAAPLSPPPPPPADASVTDGADPAGEAGGRGGAAQPGLEALGELLSGMRASATKPKQGATVYDILLQEIKAAQLAERVLTRSVLDLQRNLTALGAELTAGLASLRDELHDVRHEAGQSGEEFAAQVDSLAKAALSFLAHDMLALRLAVEAARRRDQALLAFAGALGGLLVLAGSRAGERWPWVRLLVAAAAAANGLAGAVLLARAPGPVPYSGRALQALPPGL